MRGGAITGRIVIPDDADWLQGFLGSEISATLFEVIVKKMAEERRPMIVHHPVHGHFAIGPMRRIGFILGTRVFVVGELGLA